MKEKYENLLWLVMILIMLSLSLKVYSEGKQYECNACVIDFSSKIANIGDYFPTGSVKAERLYSKYEEGVCLVEWDKVQGFRITGD